MEPRRKGAITALTPISRSTRPPYSSRAQVSRPRSSVPRRWPGPGRARTLKRFCWLGSAGARIGASSNIITITKRSASPASSVLL